MMQAIILLSACIAIALLSSKQPWRKWGFLIGFVGQPFWIIDSWQHGQWGIFGVSIWFTLCYGKGCYTHIMKGDKDHEQT